MDPQKTFLGGPVPPIYGFSGVRAYVRTCVRAGFCVRKIIEADLTMMMKIKVVSCDE